MEKEIKFIELRSLGWSFSKISNEINVSKPTLIKWSKKHKLEINNQQQLELENLRKTLMIDRLSRYEKLSEVLSKLDEKVLSSCIDNLSPHHALALWLKCVDLALKEESSPKFQSEIDFLEIKDSVESWTA